MGTFVIAFVEPRGEPETELDVSTDGDQDQKVDAGADSETQGRTKKMRKCIALAMKWLEEQQICMLIPDQYAARHQLWP